MTEHVTALALCASALFGLALVLTQFGVKHLPPAQGALVSVPTSAAMFWLLSPAMVDWQGWDPEAAAIFAASGLLLGTVALLTFEANRRMGPSVTAALGNLTPLFAVSAGAVFLGERPGLVQAAGIATIILGATLLALDRRWLGTSWPRWAMALPLAAAVLRGIAQPMTKSGLALWDEPFAAALIGYTGSSLMVVAAAWLLRRSRPPLRAGRAGIPWFILVGLSNGCATLAMYAALARGPVMLVSPLVATYPLVTLGLTTLFLRAARTSVAIALGVMATVLGVTLLVAGLSNLFA